ncbi:MAG: hypothetical protein ICV79_08325 [Flavisolibacter sp.]|nr:hypothetical protein [Flavisolibacter sp.]
MQANLFPAIKTREITVRKTLGIDPSTQQTYTSTYKTDKLNISNVQVGWLYNFKQCTNIFIWL